MSVDILRQNWSEKVVRYPCHSDTGSRTPSCLRIDPAPTFEKIQAVYRTRCLIYHLVENWYECGYLEAELE
jgi:hypothetical protein